MANEQAGAKEKLGAKNPEKPAVRVGRLVARSYGAFVRTVALPAEVKASDATAKFAGGGFEIRIPKSEAAKRSVVKVNVQ